MKLNSLIFIITLSIVILSCSKADNSTVPTAVQLVFPEKDAECKEGTIISKTESKIVFTWEPGTHNSAYTVVLEDLEVGSITEHEVVETAVELTLQRNRAYAWYVRSRNNLSEDVATSEVWRFYNAGEGVENYSPFPAEVIFPKMGAEVTTNINLEWLGKDIDDNIVRFDVYLETITPPNTLLATTTVTTLSDITLNANTIYYWQIVTWDSAGAHTPSPIFEFRTEN